jgi:hypothetical protein
MGREIRMVPPDWEHPRYTAEDRPRSSDWIGQYRPLYDEPYREAAERWLADLDLWRTGKYEDQPKPEECRYFWDWDGGPPDKSSYRDREWSPEEATRYQVYETVSEGTPVTPHFATKAELVDWLVEHGDDWDQKRRDGGWDRVAAERFVNDEWAPSMIVNHSAAGTTIETPGHPA